MSRPALLPWPGLVGLLAATWYTVAASILSAFLMGKLYTPISRAILRYGKTQVGSAESQSPAVTGRQQRSYESVCAHMLGAVSRCQVPKRWFTYFYVVGVICNTGVSMALLRTVSSCYSNFKWKYDMNDNGLVGLCIGVSLYQIHLCRRLYECIFVTRSSKSARMHVMHLAFGLIYYMLVPLTIMANALALLPPRNINEIIALLRNCGPHETVQERSAPPSSLPLVLCGSILIIVGGYGQHRCHQILANLRSQNIKVNASDGPSVHASKSAVYRIPRGDLFEFVSSPHYFYEILVYAGLALVAGSNSIFLYHKPPNATAVTGIAVLWGGVFATTFINLYASAKETHSWYVRTFGADYPESRTALVPLLL